MTYSRKIVCIVMGSHFADRMGGAQFQAKCLVEELRKADRHDIIYLARGVKEDYRPEDYEIKKISTPGRLAKHSFTFDAPHLFRMLNSIKPDMIYQRGLKPYTGIVAHYARASGCRMIFHIAHDYDVLPNKWNGGAHLYPLRWLDKKIGEYGLRRSDCVIAQTRYQAELLWRNYGRTADVILPNFHPIANNPTDKAVSPIQVIWVANFKPSKRPEIFVQLAEDLAGRHDIHFKMIGRPGEKGSYDALHKRIDAANNISYLGELPITEVNRHLDCAHIFVNTSCAEGFPNTFIQAWMRRVPTVSLSVDPDGVLSSRAIGCYAGSYEKLRQSVCELADEKNKRERMGNRARQYAIHAHSPRAAAALVDLFNV